MALTNHFLGKLGEFLRANKAALADVPPEDIDTLIKSARGYAGGKVKAERRQMSEACGRDGGWRLFFEHGFAEPPASIQVLPRPGTYRHPRYGTFTMTPEDIQKFVANHNEHVYQEQVPIDAEHETKLSGAVGYFGEMRALDGGNGGAEADVNWTDRGKQLMEGDAFKYFSPEWFDSWNDPATGQTHSNVIVGGAVTTRPFFKDKVLRPLVAAESGSYQAGEWAQESGELTLTLEPLRFSEPGEDDGALSDKLKQQLQDLAAAGAKVKVKVKQDDSRTAADPMDLIGLIAQVADLLDDDDDADDAEPVKAAINQLTQAFQDPDASEVHVNGLMKNLSVAMSNLAKNRTARMSEGHYWFRDYTTEQRKSMAKSGQAMPDGSFPIADKDDLHNAIQAFGRSPDNATKAHIKKRAAALGATGMLPDKWKAASERGGSVNDIDEKTKEFVEGEAKRLTEQLDRETGLRKAAEERLERLEREAQTRRFTDITFGRDAESDGAPPFPGERDVHLATMAVIAEKYGEDSDQFRAYVGQQRAVAKQMREAGMFKEIGTGSGPDAQRGARGEDAEKQFSAACEDWLGKNPGKQMSDAIAAVAKAQPRMYREYIRQENERAKDAPLPYEAIEG